jgi:hypothetical protein
VWFLGVGTEHEHVRVVQQFAHDKVSRLRRRRRDRYVRTSVLEPRAGLRSADLPDL